MNASPADKIPFNVPSLSLDDVSPPLFSRKVKLSKNETKSLVSRKERHREIAEGSIRIVADTDSAIPVPLCANKAAGDDRNERDTRD